ncbi:motility associated factor glycosyltransferase family protein [Clostridium botulinum]|nr:motility associated factor glycosyltransferase family protein [Clostridium botulinum]
MNFSIELSKDGYEIVKVFLNEKTQYISSKYNETREIQKFLDSLGTFKTGDNYIVFGLGCGYHIKQMQNKIDKGAKILIIEVNNELINYFKKNNKLKEIFDDKRVIIAENVTTLDIFLEENITEINVKNLKIATYGVYDKIYNEFLERYYMKIRESISRITLNRNMKLYYGNMWADLFFKNIKYMCTGMSINSYKNKFRNIPAIIVSAGPSLEKNIGELKNNRKAMIISGGRTLKALMDLEIEPDLLCVVDPLEESYKLVENYIEKLNSPLVFYEGTNNKIVKKHRGKKVFSTNSKFIRKVFDEEIQSLSGGGSVAHSMTILASYMGCNPIVFIGQDLAYTDEKIHATCASNPCGKNDVSSCNKDKGVYVKDINNNLIRTSVTLNGFRCALENIISMFPNTNFINATEGGVNINGAKNVSLKSILSELNKITLEKNLDFNDNKNSINRIKKLKNEFNKNLNLIEKFTKLYNYRKSIRENFIDLKCVNDINIIKKIRKIDSCLESIINSLTIPTDFLFNVYYEVTNFQELEIYPKENDLDKSIKLILKMDYIYRNVNELFILIKQKIINC